MLGEVASPPLIFCCSPAKTFGTILVQLQKIVPSCAFMRSVIYIGRADELLRSVPVCPAVLGHLPSGRECGKPNQSVFVYLNLCDADPVDGLGVPTPCVVFLFGQDGSFGGRIHASVSPPCLCFDRRCLGCHHSA